MVLYQPARQPGPTTGQPLGSSPGGRAPLILVKNHAPVGPSFGDCGSHAAFGRRRDGGDSRTPGGGSYCCRFERKRIHSTVVGMLLRRRTGTSPAIHGGRRRYCCGDLEPGCEAVLDRFSLHDQRTAPIARGKL